MIVWIFSFADKVACLIEVVDATLLALAGLKRLSMSDVISNAQIIGWDEMLPAVAQGAIGIQCRDNDSQMLHYLSVLNHVRTKSAVDCERSFLAELDGNCRTPIAGQAKIDPSSNLLIFEGLISKPDGSDMIRVSRQGSASDAVAIGRDAALEIKAIAGDKFREYGEAVQIVQEEAAAAKAAAKATSG